jgi:hypothetical protein
MIVAREDKDRARGERAVGKGEGQGRILQYGLPILPM